MQCSEVRREPVATERIDPAEAREQPDSVRVAIAQALRRAATADVIENTMPITHRADMASP